MKMNNDIIVILGLMLYVVGAVRTYSWMRQQLESDVVNNFVGKPGKIGTFIACLLGWYLVEAVLLLLKHDQSITKGFDEKYIICPECKGQPTITRYRPMWGKPDIKCPRCGGTGIVRKDDKMGK